MAIFQVPQFLDVKPKIFGPFDFKQFIFLLIGAGFSYLSFQLFSETIAIFFSIFFIGISLFLGFFKLNGLPATKIFFKVVKFYFLEPKFYIWKKIPQKTDENVNKTQEKFSLEKESLNEIKTIRNKFFFTEKLQNLKIKLIEKKEDHKKNDDKNTFLIKKITGEKVKAKKIDYL